MGEIRCLMSPNQTIEPFIRKRCFDGVPPLQGRKFLGVSNPRLAPWAISFGPVGAQEAWRQAHYRGAFRKGEVMIPAMIGDLSRNGGTSLRRMCLHRRDLRPEERPTNAGQVPKSLSTTTVGSLLHPFVRSWKDAVIWQVPIPPLPQTRSDWHRVVSRRSGT